MAYEEQYAEIVTSRNKGEYISAEHETQSLKIFSLLEKEDIHYGDVEYCDNPIRFFNMEKGEKRG